jgi:hypothetical protein
MKLDVEKCSLFPAVVRPAPSRDPPRGIYFSSVRHGAFIHSVRPSIQRHFDFAHNARGFGQDFDYALIVAHVVPA